MKINFPFWLVLSLAPCVALSSASGYPHSGTLGHRPRLLWAWWDASRLRAMAGGFASPSAAVFIIRDGVRVIGNPHGPPLAFVDKTYSSSLSFVGGGGTIRPITPRIVRASLAMTRVSYPRKLPLPVGRERVGTGTVSANGRWIAAFVRSRHGRTAVCVWSLKKGVILKVLRSAHGRPIIMAFSPSGDRLAVGYWSHGGGGCIRIWNWRTGAIVKQLTGPKGGSGWQPTAIAYISKNRLAVLAGALYLADSAPTQTAKPVRINFKGPANSLEPIMVIGSAGGSLLVLPEGKRLIVPFGGLMKPPAIGVCSVKSGRLVRRIPLTAMGPGAFVTAFAAMPNGHNILVAMDTLMGSGIGWFCEISLRSGRMLWRSPVMAGGCDSLSVSPDGLAAITGGALGARLWRLPPVRVAGNR